MRRIGAGRAIAFVLALVALVPSAPARADVPPAVPRAVCGPDSLPESGAQGRVTAADYAAGTGSHCNVALLGQTGTLGGFRTHRYVDASGHDCAYFDVTNLLPSRPATALVDPNVTGTFVVDMSDPTVPMVTTRLLSPAMLSPHESLSLHAGRGLLAANLGNLTTAPAFVDIYDLKADCRYPSLLSSLPVGVLGHEGSFSPDGMTYWVGNPVGFFAGTDLGGIAAVDVANPVLPRLLWTSTAYTSHGLNVSPDGNTLYFADMSTHPGLTVLDVSEVQARALNPQVRQVAHLTWDTVSIPQTDIPVTIGGRAYVVEVDEFTSNTLKAFLTGSNDYSDPAAGVGAARIIDVADRTEPKVVSDIRLEVHSPEARGGEQVNDPAANSALGYAGHYCAVPKADDPGIVACSFILSGLRVFDIRDPLAPKEIAYFNPPTETGTPYAAVSAPAFAPERGEIWYTDGNYGFYALKVTNGVWPF
jgi:hypothetical protein